MNLTGKLITVGTDEAGLCRALLQLDPALVAKIEHLPMYEQVEIVPCNELTRLRGIIARNAAQRVDAEGEKMHILPSDIRDSLEILYAEIEAGRTP